MIVLDTTVLSMAFRRSSAREPHASVGLFRKLVEEDRAMCVPGVVLQELLSGVKTPEGSRRLERALSGFPLLLADRNAHVRAAEVHIACRSSGYASSSFDCLIASITLLADGELFTLDDDFTRIAKATGLKLVRL